MSQPADNYFALLQAASIAHTGPDISVQWTGLFDIKYEKFLLNLKPYFSAAEIAKINGAKWMAPDFNTSKGLLVMPLETQFYIGFYNKALFKKAGIAAPPANWNELYSDCTQAEGPGHHADGLRRRHRRARRDVLPVLRLQLPDVGHPLADAVAGPLHGQDVVDVAGDRRADVQVGARSRRRAARTRTCSPRPTSSAYFSSGKAAMIVDGNWDTATLQKGLGKNLAAFVPPYSNGKQKGVIQYPGDGFSVSSYSKHPKEAVAFLKFLTTPTAAKIISNAGLIPAIKGYKTNNPALEPDARLRSQAGLHAVPDARQRDPARGRHCRRARSSSPRSAAPRR